MNPINDWNVCCMMKVCMGTYMSLQNLLWNLFYRYLTKLKKTSNLISYLALNVVCEPLPTCQRKQKRKIHWRFYMESLFLPCIHWSFWVVNLNMSSVFILWLYVLGYCVRSPVRKRLFEVFRIQALSDIMNESMKSLKTKKKKHTKRKRQYTSDCFG